MLDRLETEKANPASQGIDSRPTEDILKIMNAEDRRVAEAVQAEIPQITKAVDGIVDRVRAGGRLFYIGAGTSGRLGVLDASECPPTFHVPPELVQGVIAGGEPALTRSTEATEDSLETGARDLTSRGFTGRDSLVGITASGRTPYVLGAVKAARAMGALTIGVSSNQDTELSREVDVSIGPRTGPEIIAGSTRLKAGTAAKLVLNMISTAVMIRLGHVYGNLMVNVQPTNSKLADRARRIVEAAAGIDRKAAERMMEESDGNVRLAILMARLGVSSEEALKRLEAAGGRLSEALADG